MVHVVNQQNAQKINRMSAAGFISLKKKSNSKMNVNEATHTADCDWLAYTEVSMVTLWGQAAESTVIYTDRQKQTDIAGEYAFTFIQR